MPTTRTIVIPGGSGYLGQQLAAAFVADGWRVVVLSRHRGKQPGVTFVQWDGYTLGAWAQAIDGADAVVNLAGRSVNCRYTARNRQQIYDSRLRSTRVLGAAIAAAARPPRVWLNSSSATIYRHAEDRPMDELTGEIGSGFSVDVCLQWEHAFFDAPAPQTRKVALRAAMVFGKGAGGVFAAFHNIVRLGLGGAMAGGQQYVSWVHLADFIGGVRWLIARDDLSGAVNIAAPQPRTNADFMRVLRLVCRQPLGLPSTRAMLAVGARLLGTETELLLKSRRVVPTRLLTSGFPFRYPKLYEALNNIVNE